MKICSKTHQIAPFKKFFRGSMPPNPPIANACLRKCAPRIHSDRQLIVCSMLYVYKGVFKGGFRGFKPPPPKFSDFFLKSEGKEIERKRKKKGWGGGLPLNKILGVIFFRVGLRYFQGGLRNFRGVEQFSGGVEKFSRWAEKFSGGGLRNFLGG